MSNWANIKILRWARERLKMSYEDVEELSRKLGKFYTPIDAGELEKWEKGLSQPELEHLETLAEIYVCPVGYFFLDEVPREQDALSFRGLSKNADELSPSSLRTLHLFLEKARMIVHIIKEAGVEIKKEIRQGQYSAYDNPVEIARIERIRLGFSPNVRAEWNGYEDAFNWWRQRIESQGVFCLQMKLEPSEIRGASAWIEGYPFILINHSDAEAATGRLFTLLHEYAHILISNEGLVCDFRGVEKGKNPEPFANKFAANCLISKDEFRRKLIELGENKFKENRSDRVLEEIKKALFVSKDVVAIMLQEMNLAPKDFYARKRAQWDKRKLWGRGGKRQKMPEKKFNEFGLMTTRLIAHKNLEEKIPIIELSYLLDMKVERVKEFISWARQKVPA